MSVPILAELSAMAMIALSAICAAFTASPPSACFKLAPNETACSAYVLAEIPAEAAAFAYCFTDSAAVV